MRMEEVKQIIEVESKEKVAIYTEKDIAELIIKDLENRGMKTKQISFETDYKYVSDEWGMNAHATTVFKGATVKIEQRR